MSEEKNLIQSKKMESQMAQIKEYSHEQLMQMAEIYFKSGLLPSHLKSKEAAYIAMQWAHSLQLNPFLGLRDIYVIENIPTLKTEAALAITEQSGYLDTIEQYFSGNPFDDTYTAICKIKRKGRKEHISKFSVADAKLAGLWGKKTHNGKPTSWVSYPHRMMMYRSVGFALRDIFPDVLRGAKIFEEIIGYEDVTIIKDTSTADSVNVEIKKTNNKYGKPKMTDSIGDMPPDDEGFTQTEEVK